MAKRRRRRARRRGTGNIITTRRVSGLGKLGNIKSPSSFAGSFLPPLLGGGLTALATIAIAKMGQQQQQQPQGWLGNQDQPQQQQGGGLSDYAEALGIGLGGVGAFFLGSTLGKPAGYAAAAGAIGVGGALLIHKMLNSQQQQQPQGTGAIVAEYGTAGLGHAGTGAIVMEPNSAQGYNAYSGGADVNLRGGLSGAGGLGAGMDVSAFGPSSF